MMRSLTRIALAGASLFACAAHAASKEEWLSDYEQLKDHLARYYGNLEPMLAEQGIDAAQLNEKTERDLREAKTSRESLFAVMRFLAAMHDAHLGIKGTPVHLVEKMARYEAKLSENETGIHLEGKGCAATSEDVVTAFNGDPIAAHIGFVASHLNEAPLQAHRKALLISTRPPFAPLEGLHLSLRRPDGSAFACSFPAIAVKRDEVSPAPTTQPAASAPPPLDAATPPALACETLGFSEPRSDPSLRDYVSQQVWSHQKGILASAVVDTEKFRIGYLAIPSFDAKRYVPQCQRAWKNFRREFSGTCDPQCRTRFTGLVVANEILSDLQEELVALKARQVRAVLVDLRGNGGGGDWAEAAARLFVPRLTQCSDIRSVRHPKFASAVTDLISELEALSHSARMNRFESHLLAAFLSQQRQLQRELREECSVSSVWSGKKNSCSLLATTPVSACGLVSTIPPRRVRNPELKRVLFPKIADLRFAEGVWRGPLFVAMGPDTISAAEEFVTNVQSSPGTTTLGEPSAGAGCGFRNGGLPLVLRHTALEIRVPDCARTVQGVPFAGVRPDVPVERADTPASLVKAAATHLSTVSSQNSSRRQREMTRYTSSPEKPQLR